MVYSLCPPFIFLHNHNPGREKTSDSKSPQRDFPVAKCGSEPLHRVSHCLKKLFPRITSQPATCTENQASIFYTKPAYTMKGLRSFFSPKNIWALAWFITANPILILFTVFPSIEKGVGKPMALAPFPTVDSQKVSCHWIWKFHFSQLTGNVKPLATRTC